MHGVFKEITGSRNERTWSWWLCPHLDQNLASAQWRWRLPPHTMPSRPYSPLHLPEWQTWPRARQRCCLFLGNASWLALSLNCLRKEKKSTIRSWCSMTILSIICRSYSSAASLFHFFILPTLNVVKWILSYDVFPIRCRVDICLLLTLAVPGRRCKCRHNRFQDATQIPKWVSPDNASVYERKCKACMEHEARHDGQKVKT